MPHIVLFSGKKTLSSSPWMCTLGEKLRELGARVTFFDLHEPYDDDHFLMSQVSMCIESLQTLDYCIIGGKSQGGRITSLVADKYHLKGIFCIGYPFYTPDIKDLRRIDPLKEIKTPMLILQGEHDVYGEKRVVEPFDQLLSSQVIIQWKEGGDHHLRKEISWISLELLKFWEKIQNK